MTDLLDQAVAAVRQLPQPAQDDLARAILSLTEGGAQDNIEPEHLPFVLEGLSQIARGDFATEAQVDEVFRSFEG